MKVNQSYVEIIVGSFFTYNLQYFNYSQKQLAILSANCSTTEKLYQAPGAFSICEVLDGLKDRGLIREEIYIKNQILMPFITLRQPQF